MSDCIPITRFDQRKRSVNITDRSIEILREFYVEPYEAYPEVAEYLLGRPEVSGDDAHLIQPPARDPFHNGVVGFNIHSGGAIYCNRVEVDHPPSDISTAHGPESTDENGNPIFNPITGEAASSSPTCQERFKGALVKAWYKERPEWSIDINPTTRNFTIPTKLLQWADIYKAELDAQGNLALGSRLQVSRDGLQGGINAVKLDTNIEIVVTPRRLFSNQFGKATSPNPPAMLTWGALQGRVNDSRCLFMALRGNDGRALQVFSFPAGTLKYEGFRPRADLTSLSPTFNPGQSPYIRVDGDGCPHYNLAYDYWDHSHIFTFKATAEFSYELIRGFTAANAFNGACGGFNGVGDVSLYYPGWNRWWYPGNVAAATPDSNGNPTPAISGIWDLMTWPNSNRHVYQDETEIVFGARKGFELLF